MAPVRAAAAGGGRGELELVMPLYHLNMHIAQNYMFN